MDLQDELLQQFLIEGRELVERATADVSALKAAPQDRGRLDALFRSLHTLKGSAALFDLPALVRLLHAAEERLAAARQAAGPPPLGPVTETLDLTERWLDALAGGGPSGDLIESTSRLAARLDAAGGAAADEGSAEAPQGLVRVVYQPPRDAYFRGEDPLAIARGLPGLVRLSVAAEPEATPAAYDPFACVLKLTAWCAAPLSAVGAAVRLLGDEAQVVAEAAAPSPEPAEAPGLDLRTLRIESARLDALAGLVDELVVAKNALLHLTGARADETRAMANARAALDRLVGDLHAGVTDLRLVDLGRLFSRFPRQVREMAEALGKAVDLTTAGDGLKLDKAVIEGLYEPVLHLVRNALDHGVETPAAREAAGKPARATLRLAARAQGDTVLVEVTDDGRGLDLARIRQKAVERGLIAAEAAAALEDAAAAELVFLPGFSTAATVSDVSGRGVGMDAVRAAVGRLGGRVTLRSQPGAGLTVSLALPARVMLTKLLTVVAGGERFAAPLESVVELHQVSQAELTEIRAERAYVRRETVIPLLKLAELLGLPAAPEPARFPALSVEVEGAPVGLQVDAVGERWEAPMRPLAGLLADYPGVLGTVTEGDGRVLLVLDLAELAG